MKLQPLFSSYSILQSCYQRETPDFLKIKQSFFPSYSFRNQKEKQKKSRKPNRASQVSKKNTRMYPTYSPCEPTEKRSGAKKRTLLWPQKKPSLHPFFGAPKPKRSPPLGSFVSAVPSSRHPQPPSTGSPPVHAKPAAGLQPPAPATDAQPPPTKPHPPFKPQTPIPSSCQNLPKLPPSPKAIASSAKPGDLPTASAAGEKRRGTWLSDGGRAGLGGGRGPLQRAPPRLAQPLLLLRRLLRHPALPFLLQRHRRQAAALRDR